MAKNTVLKPGRGKSAAPASRDARNNGALSVVKPGRPRDKGQVRKNISKNIEKNTKFARIKTWMQENLPPPGTPEWEALCTHCGKCCYDKIWAGNRLLLLTSPCSFLDTKTERCTCYDERFEREPLCLPINHEIILMGGLPEDCPYVAGLPGYKGPIPVDKTIDEC
ncbi:MAG: hypothetical protein O2807_06335 [bacterium]|nr:hypothetical protein [bacterium]